MNVLIAEDNPINQALHERIMERWGYDFDVASNGIEAVEYAELNKGKYDFCLMDVEMPEMNGIEAARIIWEKVSYFPIMALSANSEYKSQCLEVGMDGFFEKPCAPSVLFKKIKEFIVKLHRLTFENSGFVINEELPVDHQHAKELRKLKNHGLVKMRLDGPNEREVIAHKNIPNKISHDFNVNKYLMTEFLNRDADRPTVCDLYRGNRSCIVETFLDEDEYLEKANAEDGELEKYTTKVFRSEDE
ncbi:MAG: response regulator [Ectothiorhodospiraceae bacterium]|nr:response regulator [Ectothiorhodospiraceae bacterium]